MKIQQPVNLTGAKNLLGFFTLCLCVSLATPAFAQADSAKKTVSYKPSVDGVVKVRFEYALQENTSRFNVRNSRLGVKGNVSSNLSYRSQMELSSEGKFSVLDAYITYSPLSLVSLQLGQQHLTINSDLGRSPIQNIFANRSFLTDFGTTYIDTTGTLRSLNSRDIGGVLIANFAQWMPMLVRLGAYNGSGLNNPQWRKSMLYTAKIEAGKSTGLWASVSGLYGATDKTDALSLLGCEARYVAADFTIQGEAMQRIGKRKNLTTAFVQGFYKFAFRPNIYATYIAPTLRCDLLKNGLTGALGSADSFDAQRLTAGVNIGFAKKVLVGEFRVNYEKAFAEKGVRDVAKELLSDKVTLELVLGF